MHIATLPVYSKLADPDDIPPEVAARLPKNWQLSQHQLETYRALRDDNVDVVINTAMTGDGKSLAGLLPLLTDPSHNGTLALFPTNELIQDQLASARQTLPAWQRPADWVAALYSARLDELYADTEQLSRAETLLRELTNQRLLLSNPDVLHAILQFRYQQRGRVPTHIVGQLPLLFDQLTFDEFHLFETPQVVAVLTGLIFLAIQQPGLKTLFLSATPSSETRELLDRAGFAGRLRLVEPQEAGGYHHGDDPGTGWRPILQGSTLTFAPQSAEEWVAAGGDQLILDWFRAHRPGAKAALIVNSVATALRLVDRLRPRFAQEGLHIAPNTGITGRAERTASYAADLLIGTSTIDVGVDFRINLLVFEAGSAGAFLQRLGRLGRHASYTDRDNQAQRFAAFAAHALIPPFVYERLTMPEAGSPARLTPGETYTRAQLADAVRIAFPSAAPFKSYPRLWGRFVPARVVRTLTSKTLRASFAPVAEQLFRRYGALTQSRVGDALREWQSHQESGEELLIEEAQSFRGGSPFECGVLKEDERDAIAYDLLWLLANAQLELISREAFCATLRGFGRPDTAYTRGFQKFFFRWRGLRSQREPVTVILGPQVAAWGPERQQTAQILPGLQLDCAGHDFLPRLNRSLIDSPCVGIVIPAHEPGQVRRALYLPPGIQLWSYRADSAHGEQRGAVAFGRDALLLDSKLRSRPLNDLSDAPIVC